MAKKKIPIKDRVESYIQAIFDDMPSPGKSNTVAYLHDIFVWQTISKLADSRLKKAWKAAQPEILPEDDELRSKGEGDYIVEEAGPYSATVKVSQGRQMFSKDLFIDAVAKEYKIDRRKLMALSETCYARSKCPVEKRIIEVT